MESRPLRAGLLRRHHRRRRSRCRLGPSFISWHVWYVLATVTSRDGPSHKRKKTGSNLATSGGESRRIKPKSPALYSANRSQVMGVGGLCGLSIPEDNGTEIYDNPLEPNKICLQGASVCRLVRGAAPPFPSLNGQRGERYCPTTKLQIQINIGSRRECCGVCSAAALPSFSYFRTWSCQVGLPTAGQLSQRQPASGWYRCVGWRQRYLRRRASSIDNGGRC